MTEFSNDLAACIEQAHSSYYDSAEEEGLVPPAPSFIPIYYNFYSGPSAGYSSESSGYSTDTESEGYRTPSPEPTGSLPLKMAGLHIDEAGAVISQMGTMELNAAQLTQEEPPLMSDPSFSPGPGRVLVNVEGAYYFTLPRKVKRTV
jgi:hypothetical protein